jgi:outer membrane lipoprotein carrier protein
MRLIITLAAIVAALGTAFPAAASGLDQLRSFLEGTKSARGAFSQSVIAKSGRKPQQSAGIFAMARPGKFRWSYEVPYPQLLVSDGKTFWSYDPELKQAVSKKLGQALGASPAALLAGGDLEKTFELRDGGVGDGLEFAEATPKQSEASFTRIRIGLRDNLPVSMEIHDNFGQVTRLVFTQFERNPPVDPAIFRFVPPKGADVVGE